jgi:hypothetical protein
MPPFEETAIAGLAYVDPVMPRGSTSPFNRLYFVEGQLRTFLGMIAYAKAALSLVAGRDRGNDVRLHEQMQFAARKGTALEDGTTRFQMHCR